MNNKHEKKFFLYILAGLIFTTAGISAIIYACFYKAHQQDWIFWSVTSAVAINAGLLFIASSVVHKVKADLIRRQKQKNKGDRSLD
jgi:uncharacterized membrane protein HdeD (DUF308 family)